MSEALTYKADAGLTAGARHNGPAAWPTGRWILTPRTAMPCIQRACAYAESDMPDEGLCAILHRAIRKTDSLRVQAGRDSSFVSLHEHPRFLEMVVLPNRDEDHG